MLEILHSEPFSIKMVQWIVYIITQYTSQYKKRPHYQCASENYNMHPAQSRVYEAEQVPQKNSIIMYDFFFCIFIFQISNKLHTSQKSVHTLRMNSN